MKIELLTIGDELLLGQTVDTNAAWLSKELATLGVAVARRSTVGDVADEIKGAVHEALERTGAVITTGGLGPTADDLTKPTIAELFARELEPDETLWEDLKRLWRERGRPGEIPLSNRVQIMIPRGARVLANRHGTAPGIYLEDDRGRWVAMLPGVPREMRGLFADAIVPLIRERIGDAPIVIRTHTLRTTGIAESQLPHQLGEYVRDVRGLPLAYLPGPEGVDLRVTAWGLPGDEADARLEEAAVILRERVGRWTYAEGSTDMAEVVLALCRHSGLRISVAESCTGGMLGARLTAISGSSDVFLGGVIAYHDDVKHALAGVPRELLESHGAVSDPVARALASGARSTTGAEIGIGITGVAGPGGGTPEKPVGLVWIAVDVAGSVRVVGPRLVGDRAEIRFRATQAALEMVRRALTSPAES